MSDQVRPSNSQERNANPLRPERLDEVIGQDRAKHLLNAAIDSCFARKTPLDHTLLVAASGLGKSTFSHVIANELGVDVYEVEAPVSFETLAELRTTMYPKDILKIEEIHQQGMPGRGTMGATQPEVLYALMEDRVFQTPNGTLPYPAITIIGTTTDEGMLPDAFVNRFALRPHLVPYTPNELETIARGNAAILGLSITDDAVRVLANASRGVPRQINNLVKNALMLTTPGQTLTRDGALEVLALNGVEPDGLTPDMVGMLTFLYERAGRTNQDGETIYQASVTTIATAIGKSRDSKAISLRVEPYLIQLGFVQVGHGGRSLTDAGVRRAKELIA